jgi:hypothetical protein
MRKKQLRGRVRERSLLVDGVRFRFRGPAEGCGVPVTGGVAREVCCSVTGVGMMNGRSGLGVSSLRGGMVALLLVVLNGINFTDFASHAKVGNLTDTRFVDQNIFQLDVSMNVADGVVDVLETSHDLPEHHSYVIVWESGVTVALKDVVQGAGRAILSDEVIGVKRMLGLEQRQDVFVVERRPDLGFVVQALSFRFWIWLAGYVRATYDLYGDDISGRGSSGTDGGEAASTDDGAENITGDGLTLIIRKNDGGVDVWTEGGEEESGRRRGKVAHGEGRG